MALNRVHNEREPDKAPGTLWREIDRLGVTEKKPYTPTNKDALRSRRLGGRYGRSPSGVRLHDHTPCTNERRLRINVQGAHGRRGDRSSKDS